MLNSSVVVLACLHISKDNSMKTVKFAINLKQDQQAIDFVKYLLSII